MWRQVRGPAGAVTCETRDVGIKWPQWHVLILEGQVRVEMRYVCPKNVKKMLLNQARTIYWKKWAARHEYEELKEGIVAQEDEGGVDRQASQRRKEVGLGRRMGAGQTV